MALSTCSSDVVGLIALYVVDTSIELQTAPHLLQLCLLLTELGHEIKTFNFLLSNGLCFDDDEWFLKRWADDYVSFRKYLFVTRSLLRQNVSSRAVMNWFCDNEKTDTFSILIELGCEVHDFHLREAIKYEAKSNVELMLQKGKLKDRAWMGCLCAAVEKHERRILINLIEHPVIRDWLQSTPFRVKILVVHICKLPKAQHASSHVFRAFQILWKTKLIHPRIANQALKEAARHGHWKLVTWLLQRHRKRRFLTQDALNESLVFLNVEELDSTHSDFGNVVNKLLDGNADINSVIEGKTILERACWWGDEKLPLVQLLLSKKPIIRTRDLETAVAGYDKYKVVSLLLLENVYISLSVLEQACFFDQPNIMKMLLYTKFHNDTSCFCLVLQALHGVWHIAALIRQYLYSEKTCDACILAQNSVVQGDIAPFNEYKCCTTVGCIFTPGSHGAWIREGKSAYTFDQKRWATGKWTDGKWMLEKDTLQLLAFDRSHSVNFHKDPNRCHSALLHVQHFGKNRPT